MPRDEEILKRRARFVSAAILLVSGGCTREKTTAVATPESESVKQLPDAAVVTPPPRVAPPANRPPLTAKTTAAGEARRDAAIARIEKVYAEIDRLAGAIPAACVVGETSCLARFAKFADELELAEQSNRRLSPPRCPAKLADDIAIESMLAAHEGWMEGWLSSIRTVTGNTADAGAAWDELRADAAASHPQPCLKFACP